MYPICYLSKFSQLFVSQFVLILKKTTIECWSIYYQIIEIPFIQIMKAVFLYWLQLRQHFKFSAQIEMFFSQICISHQMMICLTSIVPRSKTKWYKHQKIKKLSLNSWLNTYQTLTNDDQKLILCLPYFITTVRKNV